MMNTQSTSSHLQRDSSSESVNDPSQPLSEGRPDEEGEFALPQPDPDNITVLTNKLPDKPILPWNRYDSPWRGEEEERAIQEAEPEASQGRDCNPVGNEQAPRCPLPPLEGEITAQLPVKMEENEEPEVDEVE
ncbi:MAG: hypothetical protein SW833_07930 [Cyanobacteriota bacterium]|nr:hypothetical protein [Cyanobacteriota bacterium]